jgi:hypothetical protein
MDKLMDNLEGSQTELEGSRGTLQSQEGTLRDSVARVVVPAVAGSNPVAHPQKPLQMAC